MITDPISYSINYLADVSRDIPNMVVELSFLVMSGLIVMVFAFAKGIDSARKGVMTAVLLEYVFLILGSTVFYRTSGDVMNFNLAPFWSYAAIFEGERELLKQNLMNIALGIPVGFLLSFMMRRRCWWKAAVVGCLFSSIIELSQLVLKRGLCELDDVFHNTLGCIIGYGCGLLMVYLIDQIRSRRN